MAFVVHCCLQIDTQTQLGENVPTLVGGNGGTLTLVLLKSSDNQTPLKVPSEIWSATAQWDVSQSTWQSHHSLCH